MSMWRTKQAGGFDVRILGYTIESFAGDGKFGPWQRLSIQLNTLSDGADEPRVRFLDGGFLAKSDVNVVTVSKDGSTLVGGDESQPVIDPDSEVAKFMDSYVEKGGVLGDVTGRSFKEIVGRRIALTTVPDEEAQKRLGPQKGKDGKDYDRTQLRVAAVHPADGFKATAPKGQAKTTASKPAATKAAPAADVDYSGADAALASILAGTDNGEIEKGGLSSAVVKYALEQKMAGAEREALRKVVASDAYLASAVERGLIVIGGDAKKPVIVNAAVPA